MVLGSGIRDPGSEKNLFRIPDPGVKKHPIPDPGSRIRIRNTAYHSVSRGFISMFGDDLCFTQCCGSGIRDWVLFDPWIRDPE